MTVTAVRSSTVVDAEHQVVVALRASRRAAAELAALPLPDRPAENWSRDAVDRANGCADLLDAALAELDRVEAEVGG